MNKCPFCSSFTPDNSTKCVHCKEDLRVVNRIRIPLSKLIFERYILRDDDLPEDYAPGNYRYIKHTLKKDYPPDLVAYPLLLFTQYIQIIPRFRREVAPYLFKVEPPQEIKDGIFQKIDSDAYGPSFITIYLFESLDYAGKFFEYYEKTEQSAYQKFSSSGIEGMNDAKSNENAEYSSSRGDQFAKELGGICQKAFWEPSEKIERSWENNSIYNVPFSIFDERPLYKYSIAKAWLGYSNIEITLFGIEEPQAIRKLLGRTLSRLQPYVCP